MGPDHVGIGLDYVYDQATWHRYITATSVGHYLRQGYLGEEEIRYVEPEQLPAVTDSLLKLGYPDEAVQGVLGANWLRIMGRVWK